MIDLRLLGRHGQPIAGQGQPAHRRARRTQRLARTQGQGPAVHRALRPTGEQPLAVCAKEQITRRPLVRLEEPRGPVRDEVIDLDLPIEPRHGHQATVGRHRGPPHQREAGDGDRHHPPWFEAPHRRGTGAPGGVLRQGAALCGGFAEAGLFGPLQHAVGPDDLIEEQAPGDDKQQQHGGHHPAPAAAALWPRCGVWNEQLLDQAVAGRHRPVPLFTDLLELGLQRLEAPIGSCFALLSCGHRSMDVPAS